MIDFNFARKGNHFYKKNEDLQAEMNQKDSFLTKNQKYQIDTVT